MRLFTVLLCSLFVNIGGWDKADAHLTRDQAACFKKGEPRQVPVGKIWVDGKPQPATSIDLENGLVVESYDTDKDGKADLVTLSHDVIGSNDHRPFPLFYLLDLDKDEQPDAIYVDREGNGFCSDIVLYEDLSMPHDAGLEFKEDTQTKKGRAI
jgi:hypothetical protein